MSTAYEDQLDSHLPDWIDIMVHPRSAIQRIVATWSLVDSWPDVETCAAG